MSLFPRSQEKRTIGEKLRVFPLLAIEAELGRDQLIAAQQKTDAEDLRHGALPMQRVVERPVVETPAAPAPAAVAPQEAQPVTQPVTLNPAGLDEASLRSIINEHSTPASEMRDQQRNYYDAA